MVNNYHLKDVSPIKNGDSEFPLPCLFTGGQLLKITMLRSFPQPPSQCASSASRPAAACKALRKRTSSGSSGRVSRSCFKGKGRQIGRFCWDVVPWRPLRKKTYPPHWSLTAKALQKLPFQKRKGSSSNYLFWRDDVKLRRVYALHTTTFFWGRKEKIPIRRWIDFITSNKLPPSPMRPERSLHTDGPKAP